jgi:DNA-binding transcriptional LysR family regulator
LARTLNLYHLRVYCAVVEGGGVLEAARRLRVTQPVVSRILASVAQHFGAALFARQGRRLAVTEEGWAVYRHAREVLRQEEEITRAIADIQQGEAGLIAFAVTNGVGSYVVPLLWARFAALHPLAELDLQIRDSETAFQLVLSGSAELGLGVLREVPHGLVAEPLATQPCALVCGPSHRLVGAGVVGADDLGVETFICPKGAFAWRDVDRYLRQRGVLGSYRIKQFGDTEAVKHAVEAGLGIAFLPYCAISRELAAGSLRELTVDGPGFTSDLVLVSKGQQALGRLQAQFRDFLRAEMPPLLADGRGSAAARRTEKAEMHSPGETARVASRGARSAREQVSGSAAATHLRQRKGAS